MVLTFSGMSNFVEIYRLIESQRFFVAIILVDLN